MDTALAPWDDGPADGTRLAADIHSTVPEANAAWNRAAWRANLRRRIQARLTARTTEEP